MVISSNIFFPKQQELSADIYISNLQKAAENIIKEQKDIDETYWKTYRKMLSQYRQKINKAKSITEKNNILKHLQQTIKFYKQRIIR
jgi:vacuolar-type H+-ATPase subunit H